MRHYGEWVSDEGAHCLGRNGRDAMIDERPGDVYFLIAALLLVVGFVQLAMLR